MMHKRNIVPVLYCAVFPLLIGFFLLVLPELFALVNQEAPIIARVIRGLLAIWLIWAYVTIGTQFIADPESSSIKYVKALKRVNYMLDEKNESRVARSIFPAYFVLSKILLCVGISVALLGAISTFIELPPPAQVGIATVNFVLLILPHLALYRYLLRATYGNESP
jgi:hypothetical protein